MNGVLGHDSALVRLYWAVDWADDTNFAMKHMPLVQDRSLDLLASSHIRYARPIPFVTVRTHYVSYEWVPRNVVRLTLNDFPNQTI